MLPEDPREVLLRFADVFAHHPGQIDLVELEAELACDNLGRHGLPVPGAPRTGRQPLPCESRVPKPTLENVMVMLTCAHNSRNRSHFRGQNQCSRNSRFDFQREVSQGVIDCRRHAENSSASDILRSASRIHCARCGRRRRSGRGELQLAREQRRPSCFAGFRAPELARHADSRIETLGAESRTCWKVRPWNSEPAYQACLKQERELTYRAMSPASRCASALCGCRCPEARPGSRPKRRLQQQAFTHGEAERISDPAARSTALRDRHIRPAAGASCSPEHQLACLGLVRPVEIDHQAAALGFSENSRLINARRRPGAQDRRQGRLRAHRPDQSQRVLEARSTTFKPR